MPETTNANNRVRVTVEIVNPYGQTHREPPAVWRVFTFSNDAIGGKVAGSDIGRHVIALCRAIEENPEAYRREPGAYRREPGGPA